MDGWKTILSLWNGSFLGEILIFGGEGGYNMFPLQVYALLYIPGGGFKYVLFSPLLGEDFQFD